MRELSEIQLSELTGKTRATIRKKLSNVTHKPGPHRARLYDSTVALGAIYGQTEEDGAAFVSSPEAQRQLTIARKEQIDLQNEVLRQERVPIEDLNEINEEALGNVAALLKASTGKVLDEEMVNDLFTHMRDIGAKIRERTA